MGTSKGYQAPTGPMWSKLKKDVTQSSGSGSIPESEGLNLLRDFIKVTTSGDSGSTKSSRHSSKELQNVGRKFASFSSSIASVGLDKTLRELGLEKIIGRSSQDAIICIMEYLCGDSNIFDEVDANKAIIDLLKELSENTQTYEEVKEKLEATVQPSSLGLLLMKFIGYYIYHKFCRAFFERLLTRHGENITQSFLDSLKSCIKWALTAKTLDLNFASVDWNGHQGEEIIDNIISETYEVFLGENR